MEPFSLVRFFGGFNIFDGAKLGKLLFYAVLITIALTIYHKAFEPKTVIEKQVVEKQIVNNCPEDPKVIGFRLNVWKLRLGGGI